MTLKLAFPLSAFAIAAALTASAQNAAFAAEGAVVRDHRGTERPLTRSGSSGGYTPGRVIRDHRANPQPWKTPPHWHKHF